MGRTAESPRHLHLKKLALFWAQGEGYAACAFEVRLPHSGYRADLAAYKPSSKPIEITDPRSRQTRRVTQAAVGTTAVFECKQARSDFVRDSHSVEPTLARLRALDARRIRLEELLKVHHPSLRNGDSLFEGFDSYDFSKLEHRTYRRIVRELAVLQNRLYDKTKFDKVARYRCANLCYLVVDEGVLTGQESPFGWGLLVHRDGNLVLARKPVWQETDEPTRLWLLHRIAIAGTRRLNREHSIAWEPTRPTRP